MKKVFYFIIIIALIVVPLGCVRKNDANDNLNLDFRYLSDKNVDGDKNYAIFSTTEEDIKLLIEDEKLFDSLLDEEFYMVAYSDDKILQSIETNPFLKEIYLNSMKEGMEDKEIKKIPPVEKVSFDDLALLNSYPFDFDKDGEDEEIVMYAAAGKDNKGNIAWDDGQIWILAVRDTDKDYVLFNGWVQLGNIGFSVYTIEEKFYISTLSTGTADLTLKNYEYDAVNDIFLENIEFNAEGNVNMIFNSYAY